jgi:predicted transposase YbfD/YdcC
LSGIVVITITAVLCGAEGFEVIEEFGNAKYEWFKTFLELPHGIPSHDTFERFFAALDPKEFRKAFLSWVTEVAQICEGQVIGIDGKTLRRSHDKSNNKSAIHMVSAWGSENRLVLGQVKTDEKSNEITAIPELLKVLELKGCIVTIDAMGCQKEIAAQIVDKVGDYIFGLKGNQGNLHKDVQLFFEDAKERDFKDIQYNYYETTDGEHGRIEVRRYWIVSDIDWLDGRELWKKLQVIGMVESERHIHNQVSRETRYYISSIEPDIRRFAGGVRGHWGVENSLHWTLDVTFREDESRIRKGHAPENMAVVRHICLNLLREEKTSQKSIRIKRLKSGWDNNYLLKVLSLS